MSDAVIGGRYHLLEPVGAGGMGQVWRARDAVLGREVAIKVITLVGDPEAQSRFLREARTVSRLSSPHIVTLHDIGETLLAGHHTHYLVMELLQGRDLGAVLRHRSPDLPSYAEVRTWAAEVCAGLQAAHRAQVVHRDIKPSNLWLTDAGTVKILDFGIARPATDGPVHTELTGPGQWIGTPTYMSPEQIRAPHAIDARSDLYSLGCVLYTLLTGGPPFTGYGGAAVMAQHLGEPPLAPSARRPGLPEDLDRLVLRLLAKDPNQRPADADEVRRLLLPAPAALHPSGFGAPAVAGTSAPDLVDRPSAAAPTTSAASARPPTVGATAPWPQPGGPSAAAGHRGPARPRERALERSRAAVIWAGATATGTLLSALILVFTTAGLRTTVYGGAAAVIGGPLATLLFTRFLSPRQSLATRLAFGVPTTAVLGMVAVLIQTKVPQTPSWSFAVVTTALLAAVLTGLGPIAGRLARRYRLPADRARLASTSGWVNALLVYAFTVYAGRVSWWGSLAMALAVWLLTALTLCRLLGVPHPRAARTPRGTET
ncbi:protein kinase [Kitasatospora herbaricolor]|uniref:serine/threonine-protein kinase n=1 Tax=Kitasatospora herbaricolor TaxID=68217 RepID=UPI0036D87098